MSFLTDGNKAKCCGCGACAQSCPKDCIQMQMDADGYYFPEIDKDKCIGCHLCERVCPFEHVPVNKEEDKLPFLVAAKSRDDKHVLQASSGGAFGSIVRTLRKDSDWCVWGAAFDDQLQLKYCCSYDESDIAPLYKSKYVQCDLTEAFEVIKQQLEDGKNVCFSGTPCYVAALKNYIGKDQESLFCIDLVCHGVPNQKMFNLYCKEEGERFGSVVKSVQFRYKYKNIWNKWNTRNIMLVTEDGKRHVQSRYRSTFLRAYYSFLFCRESCHNCVFACPERQGDITIADFWGIEKFYKELDVNKGVSLVQVNTRQGLRVFDSLHEQMDIYPIDREKYLKLTKGAMVQASHQNSNRSGFLKMVRNDTFKNTVDHYIPKQKEWLKIEIARRLSPQFRAMLKKVLKDIKSGKKEH